MSLPAPGGLRLWAALLPAMLLPLLGALVYFVWLPGGVAARAVYTATKLFTVIWPWAALRLLLREPWPRPLFTDPRHRRAAMTGLLTGVLLAAGLAALMATPLGSAAVQAAPAIAAKARALGIRDHYWLFALFLSLGNSLLEEVYWRWFLFGNLRRVLPSWPAHLSAGAAFAAHHVVVMATFLSLPLGVAAGAAVGAAGVLWSRMMEEQRSLAGAWACHLAVDLGIMAVGYRLIFSS